ncbi:tetratricopeptide repeat protein [Aurantiacibacter odishensis]|uniref:tetratricopeptide repeat protein n=1 Tax=Aurantiacibacter odishensis TaxID=1155476 RepID=UPI000E735D5F|nr:tetratricopeptide repeat protein [Aurantiacibacter odishensis]
MAKEPTNTNVPARSKSRDRADAEQDMLMREVDEAVRQDEVGDFAKKYGWPLGIAFVLAMAAFAGFLWWQGSQEGNLEEQSDQLIVAIDELEAGNIDIADDELALLAQGEGGTAAMARMLRAGIAVERGDAEAGAALFDEIANDADLPAELRDVATIRSVTARFDQLDPQEVIDRVGPLAVADNPYYGSAGELVAHAYLAQDKNDEAGALLVDIAGNDEVPGSIRERARRLAGLLGFDAIEDVDATLAEMTGQDLEEPAVELVE